MGFQKKIRSKLIVGVREDFQRVEIKDVSGSSMSQDLQKRIGNSHPVHFLIICCHCTQ